MLNEHVFIGVLGFWGFGVLGLARAAKMRKQTASVPELPAAPVPAGAGTTTPKCRGIVIPLTANEA